MSIITGRGDTGKTDLLFGKRTAKTELRVEALGVVDELNSTLGLARAAGLATEIEAIVDRVQETLVGLMGQLACLPEDAALYEGKGFGKVVDADVTWLEEQAKSFEKKGVDSKDGPGRVRSIRWRGLGSMWRGRWRAVPSAGFWNCMSGRHLCRRRYDST